MSTGNINISAWILVSGNTFQCINVAFISQSTFYSIQKKLFYPAIHQVYTTNGALFFESAKEESEIHLFDRRCDFPGYKAKYKTYKLIDSQSGHILDFYISHVQVAGNSQRMELDGFNRSQEYIKIASITTNRHKKIRFWSTSCISLTYGMLGKTLTKKLVKLA